MINKLSTLVVFLILGLVYQFSHQAVHALSNTSFTLLPLLVISELIDEVVSDVIEPLGSAVSSLVDNLLSDLDLDSVLGGGVLGSSGVVGGLLESDGVVNGFFGYSGVVK